MSVPAIFIKETVAKGNVVSWIWDKLTNVGWEMVSSNPSAEGRIFHSTGESTQDSFFILIGEFSNYMSTKQTAVMVFTLLEGYTPGTPGVSGTKLNAAGLGYQYLFGANSSPLGPDALIDIYYHINKDRIILCFIPPLGFDTKTPKRSGMVYIGCPERFGIDISASHRSVISIADHIAYTTSDISVQLYISYPSAYNDAGVLGNIYSVGSTFPSVKPNGKYMLYSVYVGNPSEGLRGKLDSVYCIIPNGLRTGDLITDDEYTYIVIATETGSSGLTNAVFPYNCFAIRIE